MKNIASILLEKRAVVVRKDPAFVWVSGIKAPIYTDNRILISHPGARKKIVNELAKLCPDCDVIAGTATAAIPWAAWLAAELNKPMVYVRASAKGHGKENKIEGDLDNFKTAFVVEDLISTGGSSIHTVESLREAGLKVHDCVAIFSYELPESEKNFKESNVKLSVLTGFSELVEEALSKNYIKEEDKGDILRWKSDPWKWP